MASAALSERPMRRILVVGCSGAGKTTFARSLADKLALPLIHLDFHHWRPGWRLPDKADWRAKVEELAAAPLWIMDGNYSNTYDIRMPRADSLIWFDYPRAICMRRALTRIASGYGRTRPELPDDCPERLDFEFLRYIWNYRDKHRPRIVNAIKTFGGHLRIVHAEKDRDAEDFLATLKAA